MPLQLAQVHFEPICLLDLPPANPLQSALSRFLGSVHFAERLLDHRVLKGGGEGEIEVALLADLLFEALYEKHGTGALEQFVFVVGVLLLDFGPLEADSLIEEWIEMLKAPEFVYRRAQQYKFSGSIVLPRLQHSPQQPVLQILESVQLIRHLINDRFKVILLRPAFLRI